VRSLSDNFGTIGFVIIGVFIASWLISTAIYKIRKYDELEVTASPSLVESA
jgi:high-affinity nickel-transport protein